MNTPEKEMDPEMDMNENENEEEFYEEDESIVEKFQNPVFARHLLIKLHERQELTAEEVQMLIFHCDTVLLKETRSVSKPETYIIQQIVRLYNSYWELVYFHEDGEENVKESFQPQIAIPWEAM